MPPLVFIPGLQGRWEYMRRAVDALTQSCRVAAFSLCDEPVSACTFDPGRGIDSYVDQIDATLDGLEVPRAAICGVSFGGLIALRFAARRPERTSSLVLVSTPGPNSSVGSRLRLQLRHPRLFAPWFFAGAPLRLRDEIARAIPDRRARRAFKWEQARTLVRAPLSPTRMAARARLIGSWSAAADCAQVSSPTLIVTGEAGLDRIVPVAETSAYAKLISGARLAVLEHTGHLGCITRPKEFADIVSEFIINSRGAQPPRRDLRLERRLSASAERTVLSMRDAPRSPSARS